MKQFLTRAILASTLAMLPAVSDANSITISGTNGSNLSASATFGNDIAGFLTITRANTSLADANVPMDVLTAVFFNLTAGASLSATPQGQPVGSEWAVHTDVRNTYNANFGLSSSWPTALGDLQSRILPAGGGADVTLFETSVPDGGTTSILLGLSMVGVAYARRKFSI